jgi:glucosamine-6-phosphate deaminase
MTSTIQYPSESMIIASDYAALCDLVAAQIAKVVRNKPDAVLGLATGSTPLGVYDRLVHSAQHEGLDFSNVTCFNLDEYFPMTAGSPHSYHYFMAENLFKHIHCRRWFVPDGSSRFEMEVAQACSRYEAAIREAGGIDLQLLGIGRSGHIGFNEPGSTPGSRTRLVTLHTLTRADAAASFGGLENVPFQAVSMGIGTILEASEILLMASGARKAEIVHTAWTGEPTDRIPASWVRAHPKARLYLDAAAAQAFS